MLSSVAKGRPPEAVVSRWRRLWSEFSRHFFRRFREDKFFAFLIVFSGLFPCYYGAKEFLRRFWAARQAKRREQLWEEEGLDLRSHRVLTASVIQKAREKDKKRAEDEDLAESNSQRNVAVVWVDSPERRASDRAIRTVRSQLQEAKLFVPPDLEGDVRDSHYFVVSFSPDLYSWVAFEEVVRQRLGAALNDLRKKEPSVQDSVRTDRGNLSALRSREELLGSSFSLDKDEFGERLLSCKGAAAAEEDVLDYWLRDPHGIFEETAAMDAPQVISKVAQGTPVSFIPQIAQVSAVNTFPTGVIFGPKGDSGIVVLQKDDDALEAVLESARALTVEARVLVIRDPGDATLKEAALGALAWLAAGEPENGLTRCGNRAPSPPEGDMTTRESDISDATTRESAPASKSESAEVTASEVSSNDISVHMGMGCRERSDEKDEKESSDKEEIEADVGSEDGSEGSSEEEVEDDELRVGDAVLVCGCAARVVEAHTETPDHEYVVEVINQLSLESFDRDERKTWPRKDLSRFKPKRTGLVSFGQAGSVAVEIAKDSAGSVNDKSLNGLAALVCVESSVKAKRLSALRIPIQLHVGDEVRKRRLVRKLKTAKAFQKQQILKPSKTMWERVRRWMNPPVRMENGYFDEVHQDIVEPELTVAEVPLRFEVHTLNKQLFLRQTQRFLYDELEAWTDSEKPDPEQIKQKKYTSIVPILQRFSWRMAPSSMKLLGTPEAPGILDSPLSFIIAGSTVSIVSNALEVLLAREQLTLMRLACQERMDAPKVARSAGAGIALIAATEVLENTQRWLIRRGSKRFVLALKADVFSKLLQCEVPYVDKHSADSLLNVLHQDTDSVSEFFTYRFPDLIDALGYFVGGLMAMLHYSPELLCFAVFQGLVSQELLQIGEALQDYLNDISDISEPPRTSDVSGETMRNFKTVRLYNRQQHALEEYRRHLFAKRGTLLRSVSNYVYPAIWFIRSMLQTAGTVYAGRLVSRGVLEEVYLQTALTTSNNFSWRMRWLICELFENENNEWLTSGARMLVLLERKPRIELSEGIRDVELRGEIEFKHVRFSYTHALQVEGAERPKDDDMVIKGLNLRIEAGSKVGLVGKSGSGKSTMLNLIQRFYDPCEGTILLDGRPLTDYAPDFLSQTISVVTQEAVVFNMSIRQNVVWGATNATNVQVERALRAAQLWHDVERMPRRLETNALNLSGGQKQRLGIARAILKQPKLLLLDEATAALDTKSEKGVQMALSELMRGKTCVAIAHRLSTLVDSDKICVVEDGKVVEEGTHTELQLRPDGVYRELSTLAGMSAGDAAGLLKARSTAQFALNGNPTDPTLQRLMRHLEEAAEYQAVEMNRLQELQRTYERVLAVHERDGDAIAMQVELQHALHNRKLRDLNGLAMKSVVCAKKRLRGKASVLEDVELNVQDEEEHPPVPELHRHVTC